MNSQLRNDKAQHGLSQEARRDPQNSEFQIQKESFETLFEKSSNGILIIEDNHFIHCNEKIVEMLRYSSKEELLNTHPSELSPEFQPDGRNSFEKAEAMMRLAVENGSHQFEWVHTRADGEDFWAEVTLTPISLGEREIIHVIWRDISNRKKLEQKLQDHTRELELRYSELALANTELERQKRFLNQSQEIAHIGVWEYDVEKDLLYWSDEIYRIFGFEPGSFTPTYSRFLECVHPDDREGLNKVYNDSIQAKHDYYMEHRLNTPDGSLRYVEERGSHTYNEAGDVIKTLGTVHDITPRKEMEVTLLSLNRDLDSRVKEEIRKNTLQERHLMQQSRLAQMGEMISMIAHQWRQPLGAIATTAINLKLKFELESFELDTPEGQQEQAEYFTTKLTNIEQFVQNLTSTIDDFRNFYKPNKESVPTTFQAVCDKALTIIGASLETRGIEIICHYDDTTVMKLYENEMLQVILNILKNAEDNFTERQTPHPQITISANECSIMICDNGGGIPEGIIDKIFDPYFSTKDEKNGTGLGLYMSKTIIEEHHLGKLYAENHDDGVCFIIDLSKDSYE